MLYQRYGHESSKYSSEPNTSQWKLDHIIDEIEDRILYSTKYTNVAVTDHYATTAVHDNKSSPSSVIIICNRFLSLQRKYILLFFIYRITVTDCEMLFVIMVF